MTVEKHPSCVFFPPRFTEIPFLRNKIHVGHGRDEILDLSLLRAMAQPCYILACYLAVLERTGKGLQ